MKLTNKQVEDAIPATANFNGAVSFKTKLRLIRNLRHLKAAHDERMEDQTAFVYEAMTDKTKKIEPSQGGEVPLTAEEQIRFQPKRNALLKEVVEVDIHPIELYDSTIGQHPKDINHSIDVSKVPLHNEILTRLMDVVFVVSDFPPNVFEIPGANGTPVVSVTQEWDSFDRAGAGAAISRLSEWLNVQNANLNNANYAAESKDVPFSSKAFVGKE